MPGSFGWVAERRKIANYLVEIISNSANAEGMERCYSERWGNPKDMRNAVFGSLKGIFYDTECPLDKLPCRFDTLDFSIRPMEN